MKPVISAVLFAGLLSFASCGNSELREKEAALQAQQHSLDSMNQEIARRHVVDSMNAVLAARDQARTDSIRAAEEAGKERKAAVAASASSSARGRSHSHSAYSQSAAQAPAVSSDVPQEHRKGWSAKAKGALIGAGTGAAAGAIINGRNRGAGAVIGGVIGAAAGTGAGAIIDKKNGRSGKKK